MIEFRMPKIGFKILSIETGSPAIEALAKKLTARGAVFEIDFVESGVHLIAAAPSDDPTRPGKTYECEIAAAICKNQINEIHRAVEVLVAKAAQRLGVK